VGVPGEDPRRQQVTTGRRIAWNALGAIVFGSAIVNLLVTDDKGLGIFLVIVAVIVARVVVLNIAEGMR